MQKIHYLMVSMGVSGVKWESNGSQWESNGSLQFWIWRLDIILY